MSGFADTWMTPQEQYAGMWWFSFTSIVLDSAATPFSPETPKRSFLVELSL